MEKEFILPGTIAELKDALQRMVSSYHVFYQSLQIQPEVITLNCWGGLATQAVRIYYKEQDGGVSVRMLLADTSKKPNRKTEEKLSLSATNLEKRIRYFHANKNALTPMTQTQSGGSPVLSFLILIVALVAIFYALKAFFI